jgi:hypothetical protein
MMSGHRIGAGGAAIAGAVMLLSVAPIPAHAWELPYGSDPVVPLGSYLESCTDARVWEGRLVADCRRSNGRWGQSAMNDVDRCVGGIVNANGHLTCRYAQRSYDSERWPGYGSSYTYGPRGQYYDYSDYYGYGR